MNEKRAALTIVEFKKENFDLTTLAERLTQFKASASRTPTPVTVEQLQAIDASPTNVLLLQLAETETEPLLVGMVHLSIVYLEDRAHLGPIAVETESLPRGHGTPLLEAAINHVKENFTGLRRLDLSNRPSHDLASWYKKFGFVSRTEETNDPTTVYRLPLI
ncbi:MAG: N-acetylglutamate synthase-like GNAT family acetyltransferase [Patiriisocius sp.]|jgi:N-acetylglutamate synthase-like GNAT family acetyltransferase